MTIRHVVSWKLASTDPAERAEQAAAIKQGLDGLPALVPEIRRFDVGVNVLNPGDNFDVVLISEFDDAEAIARYIEHPEHEKVASFIRSVVGSRSAVDVEI